jgi:hypothetical protein
VDEERDQDVAQAMNFPNDADGDAPRRVANSGSDMSKPMRIDFLVSAPDAKSADAIADLARTRDDSVSVEKDEESDRWSCSCTKEMFATYDSVVAAQRELDAMSRPFDGYSDGCGTLGNI